MAFIFTLQTAFLLLTVSLADVERELSEQRKSAVVVVRQLNTWEKETFVSRDTIKAMQTASNVGKSKRSTVELHQITNGNTLLQLFRKDDVLSGCEMENNPSMIKQFQERFRFDKSDVVFKLKGNNTETSQFEKLIDWNELETECKRLQVESGEGIKMENQMKARRRRATIIYPGTTWCGVGNSSKSRDSVDGAHGEVDGCCKTHDQCPYTIDGFTRKYNFFNFRFHTISHCECDENFRTCLQMINSDKSNELGRVYFNLLSMKCFIFTRETVCEERNWYGKCLRHRQQYNAEIRDATKYNVGE